MTTLIVAPGHDAVNPPGILSSLSVPLWLARKQEAIRQERLLARLVIEHGIDLPELSRQHRAPGDPQALRGIPAVGGRGGVGGAIRGTRPGARL